MKIAYYLTKGIKVKNLTIGGIVGDIISFATNTVNVT